MKQIKILGVLAVALALGLTACGGSKSSKSESKSETPSSVVPSSSSQAPVESSSVPAESTSAPAESSSTPAESSKSSQSSSRHVHTFNETVWESNDTNHWHPATCEHTTQKGSNAKHEFVNVEDDSAKEQKNEAPTCTEKGHQWVKCTICGKEVYQEIKANGHSYQVVAPEDDNNVPEGGTKARAATCTEAGVKVEICSVCNDRKESEIPTIDHTFAKDGDGNDVVVWSQEANCTQGGEGKKTCTVCGHEEAVTTSELGHNYKTDADGNIEFTWTLEPSCEKAGVGTKHCERCGLDIPATEDESKALNHDIEAIGGETAPTDGTAAVRLYRCKRCGEIYMGFLANEVTNESKAHVAFEPETVTEGQEQGARFLGRPIGNALALDSRGTSVNQQNGECVYCSTETGDFIEYAFNLNAEQAATLATCRMYCDAKAADYLNGTDFFAYGASNDEWTPGFYIDGGDERFETDGEGNFVMTDDHEKAGYDSQPGAAKVDGEGNPVQVKKGKRIEDFRYVLYVDDAVVDFDDTENPTHGSNTNMQREEFVMPYTFHLHEGLNKIKFVMAGGYRSLFYKFTFRPYVEPTPITVNETAIEVREGKTAQITSEMTDLLYKSSNTGVATVAADGTVTGVKAGTATITVSKEGNYKDAKVPVTVLPPEGLVQISAQEGVIAPAATETEPAGAEWYTSQFNTSGNRLRNFQKDSTVTFTFNSELAGYFDITFNARYQGSGNAFDFKDHVAVTVNGADVAVGGRCESQNSGVDIVIGQADLVKGENTLVITTISENSPLNLHYVKVAPHQYVTVKSWSSADIKAGITEGKTLTEKDFNNSLPEVKGYKFNNNTATVTLTVEMEAAGQYDLQLLMSVKSGNQAKTGFWTQVDSTSDPKPEKDSITVNGVKVTPPAQDVDFSDCTTASDQSDNGTLMVPAWKTVCKVSLNAGENTIVIAYVAGGYSIYLCGAQLIK